MSVEVILSLVATSWLFICAVIHIFTHFGQSAVNGKACTMTRGCACARSLPFYPTIWLMYVLYVTASSCAILILRHVAMSYAAYNTFIGLVVVGAGCFESLFSFHRYCTLQHFQHSTQKMKTSLILQRYCIFVVVYLAIFYCQLQFFYWLFPGVLMVYAGFNMYCQYRFIHLLLAQYSQLSTLDAEAAPIQTKMVQSVYVMGYCSASSIILSSLVVFSLAVFCPFETNFVHTHFLIRHQMNQTVSLFFPLFWALSSFFYMFNFVRNRVFFTTLASRSKSLVRDCVELPRYSRIKSKLQRLHVAARNAPVHCHSKCAAVYDCSPMTTSTCSTRPSLPFQKHPISALKSLTVHSSPSATTATDVTGTEPSISNVHITPILYAQNAPLGAIGEHSKECAFDRGDDSDNDDDVAPPTHELVLPHIHSNVEMKANESESQQQQHAGPTLTLCSMPGGANHSSKMFSDCASSEETQDLDYDYGCQLQLDFSTERQVVIPSIFINTESAISMDLASEPSTPYTESSGYVSNSMISPKHHHQTQHVHKRSAKPDKPDKPPHVQKPNTNIPTSTPPRAEQHVFDPSTLSVIDDHALALTNSQNPTFYRSRDDDDIDARRVSVSSVNSVVSMPSMSSGKTVCITRVDDNGQETHSRTTARRASGTARKTDDCEQEEKEEDGDDEMVGFVELVLDDADDDADMNLMTRDCSASSTVLVHDQLISKQAVPNEHGVDANKSEIDKKEMLKCRSWILTDMMVEHGWTDRALLHSLQNLRQFSA